jgi:hypothetical protein
MWVFACTKLLFDGALKVVAHATHPPLIIVLGGKLALGCFATLNIDTIGTAIAVRISDLALEIIQWDIYCAGFTCYAYCFIVRFLNLLDSVNPEKTP